MRRADRLHTAHRGVYHVGHPSLSDNARLRAALLAVGVDAALSHRCAAAHWDLLPWDGYPELTTTRRTGGDAPKLLVHRVRRAPEVTAHKTFRVTTPAQTLLDLSTLVPSTRLARALGEAEYHRLVDRDHLRTLAQGRKGATTIRQALGDEAAATHSSLEDALLDLLRRAELPSPKINQELGGLHPDFLWPEERVIVETDGWGAHGRRSAFEADRAKDLDREARGYRTARVTAPQLERKPLVVLVRVGALLLGGH
jgi:very-short-patch-repair endonuclease